MQASCFIVKITASHIKALNTHFVNRNMPKRILIVYLNENQPDHNENWGGVNENPLFIPTHPSTKQEVRKQ